MSFVERSIILCPYLRGSTIGGSTVVVSKKLCFEGRTQSISVKTSRIRSVNSCFFCLKIVKTVKLKNII